MMLTKVQRLALGLLAALTITLGMVAAPMAGRAHAESVSLNAGVAHQCTASSTSSDRAAGEEIPQTTLRVADWCGAEQ